MAGAIAGEVIARPLIMTGVPYFDFVDTLGTLAFTRGSAWIWWPAGMSLHLLVGAIWGIFYAYFFWSVLRVRPILQCLLFAFVPMTLALFIMHPQFELMHPLVGSGALPYSGLFGVWGGLHEPAGIIVGHLIWGAVLGLVRPVGYATKRAQRLILGAYRSGRLVIPTEGAP